MSFWSIQKKLMFLKQEIDNGKKGSPVDSQAGGRFTVGYLMRIWLLTFIFPCSYSVRPSWSPAFLAQTCSPPSKTRTLPFLLLSSLLFVDLVKSRGGGVALVSPHP